MKRLTIVPAVCLPVFVVALAYAGVEKTKPKSTRPAVSTAPAAAPSAGLIYKGVEIDEKWISRAYQWNKDKILRNSKGEFVVCQRYRPLSPLLSRPGTVYFIPKATIPGSSRTYPFTVTPGAPRELDPKSEMLVERQAFRYGQKRNNTIYWIKEPKITIHIKTVEGGNFGGGTIVPEGTLLLPRGTFVYSRKIVNSYELLTRIDKEQFVEYLKSGKDLPVPVFLPRAMQPLATSQPVISEGSEKDLNGRIGMAENYIQNNLPKKARAILEKLIKKYPKSEQAEKARELLSEL